MGDFKDYLQSKRKDNGDFLTEKTIEKYTYYLDNYKDDLDGLIEKEKFDVLEQYMNNKIKLRGSNVLRSAFINYLEYKGVVGEVGDLERMKARNFTNSKRALQDKIMSEGEVRRLYNEASSLFMKMFISVAYDTACRKNEILSMKAGDIVFFTDDDGDFEPRGMGEGENKNIYAKVHVIGKGQKKREVYLQKTSARLLKSYISMKDLDDGDKIFVLKKDDGDPYKNQGHQVWKRLKNLGEDVLRRHIHPHCFRHTRATHIVEQGGSAINVKNYLGHEDIGTSQRYISVADRLGRQSFVRFSKDVIG